MAASDSVAPGLYSETYANVHQPRMRLSRARFGRIIVLAAALADFFTGALAIVAAARIDAWLEPGRIGFEAAHFVATGSLAVSLLTVMLLHGGGAYHIEAFRHRVHETEKAFRVAVQLALMFALIPRLLHFDVPFSASVLTGVLIFFLLTLQKQLLFSFELWLRSRGAGTDRCIVIGADKQTACAAALLLEKQTQGLRPIALTVNDYLLLTMRADYPAPALQPVTAAAVNALKMHGLVLATARLAAGDFAAVASVATRTRIPLMFLTELPTHATDRLQFVSTGSFLLTSKTDAIIQRFYPIAKRLFDIVVASLLLLLLAPAFACIALLIWLDSPGPVIFVQVRMGLRLRPFRIFKFRSMRQDVPHYALSPASPRDRRITRVGRILRRTSLDELPQLINVLKGEMSLVGPRPEMPFIVDQYNAAQLQRLEVPPGITGLWQLSADRASQIHENLHYDLDYIRTRTFTLDAAILIHTFFFAMRGV